MGAFSVCKITYLKCPQAALGPCKLGSVCIAIYPGPHSALPCHESAQWADWHSGCVPTNHPNKTRCWTWHIHGTWRGVCASEGHYVLLTSQLVCLLVLGWMLRGHRDNETRPCPRALITGEVSWCWANSIQAEWTASQDCYCPGMQSSEKRKATS